MSSWAEQDLVKAGTYLNNLPPGSTRDAAITGYTARAVTSDPEGSAIWASTIAEPAKREATLSQVVQRWRMQSPAEADGWLSHTQALSAEAKAKILQSGNTFSTQVFRTGLDQ